VDFSENSVRALQWAEALARRFQGSIVALHVMEYPGATDSFAFDFDAYQSRTIADMHEFLTPLKEMHESEVVSGSAPQEIVSAVEKYKATLIVMGTRGLRGATHKILGSTTEHVVHHAPVPVFTVGPQCVVPPAGMEKRRALMPVSSLEEPPHGYLVLRKIIRELGDAVTMMHVVSFDDPLFGINYAVHPFNVTAYEAGEKEKQLVKIGEMMLGNEGSTDASVHFGDATEEILRESALSKYDLILMGAKKERLLSKLFDSTVYRVISKSPIPVMSLKTE
jgi:nucleotide-binding universal stress UspA family protein